LVEGRNRLSRQAVVTGDVVCEIPMYTRNYVQEGGAIQLGKSAAAGSGERRGKSQEAGS